jgi:hypothetical protein
MNRTLAREVLGGLLVIAVGLFFAVGALHFRMGTLMHMGPGFFPLIVGIVTTFLGVVIVVAAFKSSETFEGVEWRPMLGVLAGIAGFAAMIGAFGLIPAMVVGVALSALGDRTSRSLQTVVLAVVSAIGAWLVFRVGLGLQIPGLKWPFGG